MAQKRGHHFSDDLKASPLDAPIRCQDAPAPNTPVTPPSPAMGFGDPPKSSNAGAPNVPAEPVQEVANPFAEKEESDSGIY